MQILIRFPDKETEQRALGKLIPRFSGKSWANGETAVPAPAVLSSPSKESRSPSLALPLMSPLRRYEVLVPLVFNDGAVVPETLVTETFTELRERFGAASWETQILHGAWEHEGVVYQDNLTRFVVDVSDTLEHRQFFQHFKEKLKQRFNQLDGWITKRIKVGGFRQAEESQSGERCFAQRLPFCRRRMITSVVSWCRRSFRVGFLRRESCGQKT